MSRSRVTGPFSGAYDRIALFLPTNAGKAVYIAKGASRLVDVSLYAQTSTAGTLTLANTTQSITWINGQTMTADTAAGVSAATLAAAGSRDIADGDTITLSGGGTLTNATVIITVYHTDHVVSSGEQPDTND